MVSNSQTNSVENVVFQGVLTLVARRKEGTWTGTMTQLNTALTNVLGKRTAKETLPGSPSALRVVLNRVVRKLRNRKISVRFDRTHDRAHSRIVSFSSR